MQSIDAFDYASISKLMGHISEIPKRHFNGSFPKYFPSFKALSAIHVGCSLAMGIAGMGYILRILYSLTCLHNMVIKIHCDFVQASWNEN